MALDYRGFYASVENDYETLQMYDIDEEENEISCWIESRVGEVSAAAIRFNAMSSLRHVRTTAV
jgi:hypothetical protein